MEKVGTEKGGETRKRCNDRVQGLLIERGLRLYQGHCEQWVALRQHCLEEDFFVLSRFRLDVLDAEAGSCCYGDDDTHRSGLGIV